MRVAVCIPTYNQARYLPKAINSVLEQRNCDFIIIVANDGSSDDTQAILDNYKKKYPDKFIIINQSVNKGLVDNLKDCIDAASENYIAILEGDDYWCDQLKLSKQLKFLESDDTVSLVHTNWIDYYEDKNEFGTINPDLNKIYIAEQHGGVEAMAEIMREEYRGIRFSSCLFRKKYLHDAIDNGILKFSSEYPTLDIVFFYAAAYFGRTAFLPDVTTVYRIQNESVSVSNNQEKIANYSLGCYKIYIDFIKTVPIDLRSINKIVRRSFKVLFPYAFRTRNFILADYLKNSSGEVGYKLRLGQKLCYLGTFNSISYLIVKGVLGIFNFFKK